jgi:hypothetical protein
MSDRNTLFFNHFHTSESNEYVNEYGGAEDWEGINHFGSPLKILESLEEEQNAVVTITEHFHTNGEEFYYELLENIKQKGGDGRINDRSINLELENSKMKILNGVEACYKGKDNHVILGGLPIDDNENYMFDDKKEFAEAVEKAEYAHPAHPFFGEFGIEEGILKEICDIVKDSSSKLFIPYTTAYGPKFDKKARGTEESEKDIYDLKQEYSTSLIVEHDHHIHLPSGMNGVGMLEDSSTRKEIPIEEIKDSKVIEPRKSDCLRDLWRIGRTYADLLPGYREKQWFWNIIDTPYNENEYKERRDKYYKKELNNLNFEKLKERSRELN